jgi:diaminohydroxyphosphoribosylaminopyrimidine deaminase/5-amino-6-(5-phosphoribosylamino)uracil reductase
MAGWWARATRGRAHVTLKLATSLDGCIALPSGESRWITGNRARAFTHLARSRCDAILVGRGTWETDRPALDVRLAGLESRSPRRLLLSASDLTDAECVASPNVAVTLDGVNDLFVEGGAQTAAAFLAADLADTLMIHRAPIFIGGGRAALTDIGLASLNDAHGRWTLIDARQLGSDRIEHYQRVRKD